MGRISRPAEVGVVALKSVVGWSLLVWMAVAPASVALGQISPKLYSVLASAQVQSDRAQITLQWPFDPDASVYFISRKAADAGSWAQLVTLGGSATNFTDSSVTVPSVYEYQIIKTNVQYTGYQYLRVGIEAPLVDQRGKIILLVASTYASDLISELTQLQ